MSLKECESDIKHLKSESMLFACEENSKENSANYLNEKQPIKNVSNKILKNCQNVTATIEGNIKNSSDIARKRWKILAKALNKPAQASMEDISVRRFTTFDVIKSQPMIINNINETATWHLYRYNQYTAIVRQPNKPLTPGALIGFNNTGNICVWPSEEALAVFVLENLDIFDSTWVLELGGGLSCLAGLMLAKYGNLSGICLTDGNPITVDNIRNIMSRNEINCFVKCSVLKWGEESKICMPVERYKYDFILCADCLFFDNIHTALLETIWYYLSSTGTALIMAPDRNETLNWFIATAQQFGFKCSLHQRYNSQIWQKHLELKESSIYDENIHYPKLLKLNKPDF